MWKRVIVHRLLVPGILFSGTSLLAQQLDPYAGKPDWYRPGHPLDPAEPGAIRTLPGFQVEKLLGVPREIGSLTTMTVDAENFVTEIQAPSPSSYRRRFTYDENRSVTKVEVENVDRKGVQDATTPWIDTRFEYDVLGRLTVKKVRSDTTTVALGRLHLLKDLMTRFPRNHLIIVHPVVDALICRAANCDRSACNRRFQGVEQHIIDNAAQEARIRFKIVGVGTSQL